jgi:hypothetical protein
MSPCDSAAISPGRGLPAIDGGARVWHADGAARSLAMAMPSRRRRPEPVPPPDLATFIGPWPRRILLWGGSSIAMVLLFAWLADYATIRSEEVERPPPEPRFFEMVPNDLMTTRDGITVPPGGRHDAADAAMRRGDLETAALLYAELSKADARDRYSAFMVACCAIERDDLDAAATALARAAAPSAPASSPLRSIRRLATLVADLRRGDRAPLLDLWLRAVAGADPSAPATGRDALREAFTSRVLRGEPTEVPLDELRERHGDSVAHDFALLLDDAPLDAARARLAASGDDAAGDELARELLALRRLVRAREPEDAERLEQALLRRSALEPENGLYDLLRARLLSPDALASAPPGAPPEPAALDPEAEEEGPAPAPITLRSGEALSDAARRPRIDSHVALLLDFETRLRRTTGDRFAAFHGTPPCSLVLLGDAALRDRIVGRALHAEPSDLRPVQVGLFDAAFALLARQHDQASDPRRVETPYDHERDARGLLATAARLELDCGAWQARVATFSPLTPLAPELRSRFEEALLPPPIPRLVDEVAARYASDLPALAATLKRLAHGG